jgi:hypothetical protein
MQQTAAGGGGLGNGTVAKECLFQPKVCLCGTFRDGRAFRRSVTAVGTSGKSAARLRPVNPPELNRTRCPTVRHTRSLVPPHHTCLWRNWALRNPTYALRDETLLHDARRPTLDKAAILYYTHNGHNTHTHTHRERDEDCNKNPQVCQWCVHVLGEVLEWGGLWRELWERDTPRLPPPQLL